MYKSWFSYPISKPYPFRWFTPVTLGGGIILIVICSLSNLSANGYYLKPLYTSDPNGTESNANAQWFRKPPFSWQSDVNAECQPHLLSVGDSFFTSNHGFSYTIRAIVDSTKNSRSTISYKNNTLQNCVPKVIRLVLRKIDTAVPPAPAWWMSWIDSTIEADLSCTIVTDDGSMTITLTPDRNSAGDHDYNYVVDDDYKNHASTWWGTRLLNSYWNGVMTAASHMTELNDKDDYVVRAVFFYTANKSRKDIQADNFFRPNWWTSSTNGMLDIPENGNVTEYNSDWYASPSFTEGLHCAKLLYSLLSLDLGNCRSPNLLLDDRALQYAILAPDDSNRAPGGLLNGSKLQVHGEGRFNKIRSPLANATYEGLTELKDSYRKFQPLMGPLGCTNATIVTQYLCSVPQQKSWGIMLFSILLADLVFLQAAWKILTWIADGLVKRHNPEAMSCQGYPTKSASYERLDGSSTPVRSISDTT